MCFDHDSRPPIPPIAGGALDAQSIELEAADGNRFQAYLARAAEPSKAGIVIFPDVRGLHAYYEDLALRFAENGIDARLTDWPLSWSPAKPPRRRPFSRISVREPPRPRSDAV